MHPTTRAEQSRPLQMKMLRKMRGCPPPVHREWTTQKVSDTLEHRSKYSHTKLSTRWKNNKTRLLGDILKAPHDDPMREFLFEPGTLRPRKPRAQWLIETYQDAYAQISPHGLFDINVETRPYKSLGQMGTLTRAPLQHSTVLTLT